MAVWFRMLSYISCTKESPEFLGKGFDKMGKCLHNPNVRPSQNIPCLSLLAANTVTKIVLKRDLMVLYAMQWYLLMLIEIRMRYMVKYDSTTPMVTPYL